MALGPMTVLRFSLAVLIVVGLGWRLGLALASGLARGRIEYGRGRGARIVRKASHPFKFWLVFAALAFLEACVLSAAVVLTWLGLFLFMGPGN